MSVHEVMSTRRWFAMGSTTLKTTTPSMTPPTETMATKLHCDKIEVSYTIVIAVICGFSFVFGILYCFFGYRFFKATMFLTGFIFGSLVTYLVCLEEDFLPFAGKVGVALTAGVLCGLITMLVEYVGLFMTGFHLGLLLAIAGLVILEQFHHPHTAWLSIGLMFGIGLLFALLTLKFQKCLTILGTSAFGAAMMVVALDYFVEMFMIVQYVWDRIKAAHSSEVCWFSWLILALWPVTFIVGTTAQWRLTGRGFDHHEVMHDRRRKVNVKKVRTRERSDVQHSRYRHLYQVRRVNGDVISTSYIQNFRDKLSTGVKKLVPTESAEVDVDSAHTVLTQVPC